MMAASYMNGDARAETSSPFAGSPEMNSPIIQLNAGITRRDLMAMVTLIGGGCASLITGGYLFWPAKQDDMQEAQKAITELRVQMKDTQDTMGKLVTAVDGLSGVVVELNDKLGKPRPRVVVKKPAPAIKPNAGLTGN